MSDSVKELRSLPTEQLIAEHDQRTAHVEPGVDYYLTELARRDAAEQTAEIVRLSRRVATFTVVIAVLTAINVVVVILAA
jgi:hypothetical protein